MLPKDSQKSYRRFVQLNLATGLLLSLLLVNTAFNWKFAHPLASTDAPITLPLEPTDYIDKILPPLPPAPVQKLETSQPKSGIIIEIDPSQAQPEAPNIPDMAEPPAIVVLPPGTKLLPPEPVDTDNYSAAARPKDGMEQFMQYVMDKVTYPDYLRDSGKSGRVMVSFIINENGKISDVKVTNGLDKSFDANLIRIILAGPDWLPAYQQGHPTISRKILPIQFTLR